MKYLPKFSSSLTSHEAVELLETVLEAERERADAGADRVAAAHPVPQGEQPILQEIIDKNINEQFFAKKQIETRSTRAQTNEAHTYVAMLFE